MISLLTLFSVVVQATNYASTTKDGKTFICGYHEDMFFQDELCFVGPDAKAIEKCVYQRTNTYFPLKARNKAFLEDFVKNSVVDDGSDQVGHHLRGYGLRACMESPDMNLDECKKREFEADPLAYEHVKSCADFLGIDNGAVVFENTPIHVKPDYIPREERAVGSWNSVAHSAVAAGASFACYCAFKVSKGWRRNARDHTNEPSVSGLHMSDLVIPSFEESDESRVDPVMQII